MGCDVSDISWLSVIPGDSRRTIHTFRVKILIPVLGPREQRLGHLAEDGRHLRQMSLGTVGGGRGPAAVKEELPFGQFPQLSGGCC